MQKAKVNELLQSWFKGTGKPNSIDGQWNIHEIIEYRRIMVSNHWYTLYTALGDDLAWDRIKDRLSKNTKGNLKQLRRKLNQRRAGYI